MSPRGRVTALIIAAILVFGVHALAGWPDAGMVAAALSGPAPSSVAMAALLVVVCWTAALVLGAVVFRLITRGGVPVRRTRAGAVAAVALATLLLAAGLARHAGGYRVCCADRSSDARAESLAR